MEAVQNARQESFPYLEVQKKKNLEVPGTRSWHLQESLIHPIISASGKDILPEEEQFKRKVENSFSTGDCKKLIYLHQVRGGIL